METIQTENRYSLIIMRIDLSQCGRSLAENAELIKVAEKGGFQGAWISEIAGLDAITSATVAALSLQEGRVGSAIFPMQTRDPLLLAMSAASLSQIAPGGFVLGLGTSTKIIIEGWHATDWGNSPLTLTRECVDLVRRFLEGERITTETGRWQYNRAQLTIEPKQRVPIYLAALNDKMLELAGEIADGVILNFVTVNDLQRAKDQVAQGAAKSGRSLDNFEFVIFFRSTVTDNYQLVQSRYQSELFTYMMAPVYQNMFARENDRDSCLEVASLWREGKRDEALDSIPESFIRSRTLVGTEQEIAQRLKEYEIAGLNSAMIMPVAIPVNDYYEDTIRSINALCNIS